METHSQQQKSIKVTHSSYKQKVYDTDNEGYAQADTGSEDETNSEDVLGENCNNKKSEMQQTTHLHRCT